MKGVRFKTSNRYLVALCAGIMLIGTGRASAADVDPLFQSMDPLEITLTGPFNKLSRDRDPEPEKRPGTLGLIDEAGQPAQFTVELEPWIRLPSAIAAMIIATAGTLIERWLFFAEAKHTVSLYYGAPDS